MANYSSTNRPAYVWDATNNVWVPIGTGPHTHSVADVQNAVVTGGGSTIQPGNANVKGLSIAGASSQTANLQEWQTSGGSALTYVDPNGNVISSASGSFANIASRNYLINGGFDVWQRGGTLATFQAGQWGPDRWTPSLYQNARYQRLALGYVNNQLSSQYALRVSSNAVASLANGSRMVAAQVIESVNTWPLAGKYVTLSFWVRFSSATATSVSNTAGGGNSSYGNWSAALWYFTSTTDAASGSTFSDSNYTSYPFTNGTFPTTWTKISFSALVPSNANNVQVRFAFDNLGSTTTDDALYYDIAQVQLEQGTIATPFIRSGNTYGGELSLCQRYYWRANAFGETNYPILGFGAGNSATQARTIMAFPVQMRIKPTVIDYAAISNFAVFTMADAQVAPTAVALDTNLTTSYSGWLSWTTAGGLTANTPYYVRGNNTSAAYLGFSAEI
jgi:hypothetical protein